MPLDQVTWSPVLVAAITGTLLGIFWYMLLAKSWMTASRVTENSTRIENGKLNLKPHVVTALANLVMATMLFGILVHVGSPSPRRGMMSGLFIWIGFVITTLSVNHTRQGKPVRLTLIDGGYWLVNLMAQGAILGWFQANS